MKCSAAYVAIFIGLAGMVSVAAADALSPVPGTLDRQTSTLPDVGPADPSTPIHFDIGLNSRDTQGLADYMKSLYDPNSPIYHHWLTPDEFCQKFGPDTAQVQQLSSYYVSYGMTAQAEPGCNLLSFQATVSQIEAAFATEIELYTFNGKPTPANSTILMTPENLLPLISGVVGIDELIPPPHPGGGLRPAR